MGNASDKSLLTVPLSLSPCPNDTFLFYGWLQKKISTNLIAEPHFADIQQLNLWGQQHLFPLMKVSIHCFGKMQEKYQLLPIGMALGKGCGPKIISKEPFSLSDMANKKIAIPGKDTTAHFLLEALCPSPKEKFFCFYHEIEGLIEKKKVDCGLIIHESRFIFQKKGFLEITDLGNLWEERFHHLLPLGGLAMDRTLPYPLKKEIVETLQISLDYAQKNSIETHPFILSHSQEKEWSVVQEHISLYVSKETEWISPIGIKALDFFLNLGETLGHYSKYTYPLFFP